jgi:alginate O-acetyltransferase complex protein AlgI
VMAFCGLRQFYRSRPATSASPTLALQANGATVALPHYLLRGALLLLFCASVLKLSAQSYSPFLYFQF